MSLSLAIECRCDECGRFVPKGYELCPTCVALTQQCFFCDEHVPQGESCCEGVLDTRCAEVRAEAAGVKAGQDYWTAEPRDKQVIETSGVAKEIVDSTGDWYEPTGGGGV